jgi:PAS domain-containing protein
MSTTRGKSKEALEAELAALASERDKLAGQIVEFQRREKSMLQRERILHATLDSTEDGILAVDEDGHVVFANRQFAHLWRIPPDLIDAGEDNELLDYVAHQLLDPDEFLARVKELYHTFGQCSDTLQFKDGRVFHRFSLPLVIDNELCGRVWTFRDAAAAHHSHNPALQERGILTLAF